MCPGSAGSPGTFAFPALHPGRSAALLVDDRLGFDLYLPARIEQRRDYDHRARRAHLREHGSVRSPDSVGIARVGQVLPGADHVLGPGAGFGEIGLIHGIPRTATCVATSELRLVRVPGEAFLHAVGPGVSFGGTGPGAAIRDYATGG